MIIDRSKWLAGHNSHIPSCLLDSIGGRCCLGFLAQSLGAKNDAIQEVGAPSEVVGACPWPERLFHKTQNVHLNSNSMDRRFDWEDVFVTLNDDTEIDSSTREAWIKEGFKTVLDIDVEFVGEYSKESYEEYYDED